MKETMITRELLATKAQPSGERSAILIASTGALDSYNERFAPGALELDRYKKNPVVLLQHGGLPIGRSESVTLDGAELTAHVRFSDAETNPDAEKAYRMVKAGDLRGVSVGARIKKRSKGTDGVTVIEQAELVEISLVSIPANPEALVVSVKSAAEEAAEFEAMLAKFGLTRSDYLQATIAEKRDSSIADADLDRMLNAQALTRDDYRAMLAAMGDR